MKEKKSSILSPVIKKRIKKFKGIKRGYYSFLFITLAFILSFFAEFLINGNAIFINYDKEFFFTAYNAGEFKQYITAKEANARLDYFSARRFKDFSERDLVNFKSERLEREDELKSMQQLEIIDHNDFKTKVFDSGLSQQEFIKQHKITSEKLVDDLKHKIKKLEDDYKKAEKFMGISSEKLEELKEDYYSAKEVKKVAKSHRKLSAFFKKENKGNFAFMAIYPFGPNEQLMLTDELGERTPPTAPDTTNWCGTDLTGRDIFARMVYGFRISISFSLCLIFVGYTLGIIVGALLGYYGGKFDLISMRLIEIWSSMPFLFTVMIITSIIKPNFLLLVGILALWGWVGTAYYIRAEVLREKSKDYVQAALAIGVSDAKIMFSHIIPNSLTPIITFFPFRIISGIGSLVSLDFLGFGLPVPTPSWGELLGQGTQNIHYWWIAISPMVAMFVTLMLVTFVGEAIREAFDPKVYSRLR